MKKNIVTRSAFVIALSASLMLTGCESYRAASPETTVPETAVVETTALTETTAAPTMTASPTPAETTAKMIPIEPIDTSIRTDFAPTLYTVTGLTATGKTAVWKDDTRETASRYLVAGDIVTVVAIVGSESRPYALLDTGEYVLLASLEAVPVATPTPTAAPKPTKAPVKETAPAATTAATTTAPTDPPPSPTTAAPAYSENCDNIRNLIISKLQEKGVWYPDAEVIGHDLIQVSVGYDSSDDRYATGYVNSKYGTPDGTGATSVSVWIADGWLYMSSTSCALPTA